MLQEQDAETFSFDPNQISRDGRCLFEVPTEEMAAGAFELLIQTGSGEQVQFEEEIWILEREEYRKLLDEITSEEFLPSPSLHGGEAVAEYIRNLIGERLDNDNFERDDLARFRLYLNMPEGALDRAFPASPIRWTTEQLVNEFREFALYGVRDVRWMLELTEHRYGLQCHGELLDPLSEAAAKSLRDLDNSQLVLLAMSKDLEELDIRQEIESDSRKFLLGASHRIDNFTVEVGHEIGVEGDLRPDRSAILRNMGFAGVTLAPNLFDEAEPKPTLDPSLLDPNEPGPTLDPALLDPNEPGPTLDPALLDEDAPGPTIDPDLLDPDAPGPTIAASLLDPTEPGETIDPDLLDPSAPGPTLTPEQLEASFIQPSGVTDLGSVTGPSPLEPDVPEPGTPDQDLDDLTP